MNNDRRMRRSKAKNDRLRISVINEVGWFDDRANRSVLVDVIDFEITERWLINI